MKPQLIQGRPVHTYGTGGTSVISVAVQPDVVNGQDMSVSIAVYGGREDGAFDFSIDEVTLENAHAACQSAGRTAQLTGITVTAGAEHVTLICRLRSPVRNGAWIYVTLNCAGIRRTLQLMA
ncbi:MAG: hypothetical protein IJ191_05190 [Treponema sp.]|nr:hypothetical protein [Treponema sp.]